LNRLFERFFTGEMARTDNRGMEPGLVISKRIVGLDEGLIHTE